MIGQRTTEDCVDSDARETKRVNRKRRENMEKRQEEGEVEREQRTFDRRTRGNRAHEQRGRRRCTDTD